MMDKKQTRINIVLRDMFDLTLFEISAGADNIVISSNEMEYIISFVREEMPELLEEKSNKYA